MTDFANLRVFMLEDETIIAMALEDMLEDMGCVLTASSSTLDDALAKAETAACDVAILDVNINGERSDPVARILQARGVPILFATGYDCTRLAIEGARVINKPYRPDMLKNALGEILAAGPGR